MAQTQTSPLSFRVYRDGNSSENVLMTVRVDEAPYLATFSLEQDTDSTTHLMIKNVVDNTLLFQAISALNNPNNSHIRRLTITNPKTDSDGENKYLPMPQDITKLLIDILAINENLRVLEFNGVLFAEFVLPLYNTLKTKNIKLLGESIGILGPNSMEVTEQLNALILADRAAQDLAKASALESLHAQKGILTTKIAEMKTLLEIHNKLSPQIQSSLDSYFSARAMNKTLEKHNIESQKKHQCAIEKLTLASSQQKAIDSELAEIVAHMGQLNAAKFEIEQRKTLAGKAIPSAIDALKKHQVNSAKKLEKWEAEKDGEKLATLHSSLDQANQQLGQNAIDMESATRALEIKHKEKDSVGTLLQSITLEIEQTQNITLDVDVPKSKAASQALLAEDNSNAIAYKAASAEFRKAIEACIALKTILGHDSVVDEILEITREYSILPSVQGDSWVLFEFPE